MPTDFPTRRVVSLDILRIAAASWVLIHHWLYPGFFMTALNQPYDVTVAPAWLHAIAINGKFGVDAFFMLSGVVIARSAIGRDAVAFGEARFVRLFPTYFLASVGAIIFGQFTLLKPPPLTAETLLSTTGLQWFVGWNYYVGAAWTLFYEVRFYMLIGAVIFLVGQLTKESLKNVCRVWIALLLLAPSLQIPWFNFLVIADYGPYFVLGMLLGICTTMKDLRSVSVAFSLALLLSWVRLVSAMHVPGIGRPGVGATILIAVVILFVLLANLEETTKSRMPAWAANAISTLALMSYPVYLIHPELGMPLIGYFRAHDVNPLLAFASALAAVLAVSYLIIRSEPVFKRILRGLLFAPVSRRKDINSGTARSNYWPPFATEQTEIPGR